MESGGFKKKGKIKSSFLFCFLLLMFCFSSFLPAAAAAAADDGDDDVDQRKVTEGKMHIEKALGNIRCRRQSTLYHSSDEEIMVKKN